MTQKRKFLQQLNEAFAHNDTGYILENVTDDIRWTIIGDRVIEGKEAFREALKEMQAEEPFTLQLKSIITHGDSASVDGTMEAPDGNKYAFCDIYKFRGSKNPKVKEMTSYVVELKKEPV